MTRRDPADPLLRQVLPLGEEVVPQAGFVADPVGDDSAKLSAGLLQKYQSRALLITTGACAVHCRYCFRRHFPYSESPRSPADWQPALDRIAADPAIDEVLLSGGDPLTLVDAQLAELARRIADIPHVQRLRIHTRLPIVIPQRVTEELIGWLRGTRLAPIVVVHANHPQEIDEVAAAALSRLVDRGIPVLNQAVLLRGVNDNAEALIGLSRRLVRLRVMPYYLHQLDRVAGAAHFEVPIARGLELIELLRRALPGYAVPRYVQEIAGENHKHVLA
jgi:EF-P beta-lysylation protein EpmB